MNADGVPEDDGPLTSVVEFDVLSILAAIADAKSLDSSVFYSNFARFRNERVEPIIERLITDSELRGTLFPLTDKDLAFALAALDERAVHEGFRFAGFYGFRGRPIKEFITTNRPASLSDTAIEPDKRGL